MQPVSFAPVLVLLAVSHASAQSGEPNAATRVVGFEARRPAETGPMPGRPALADMDGDGDLDVVVACGTCCGSKPHERSGLVVVLANDGRGNLAAVDHGKRIGPSARKIAVGDLDGDGLPDVVIAEHDTYDVTALRNAGAGRLVAFAGSPFAAAAGTRPHTHEIALADLDGDGRADVLTTNADDNTLSVLRGDGRGAFAPMAGSPFRTPARHPYDGVAVADYDGDGTLDVVVPLLRDAGLGLLRGDGRGGLVADATGVVKVSARPGYAVAADVDGDGDADVVGSHDDTGVLDVLVNDGKGTLALRSTDLGTPVWGLATADLDGDGRIDLACGAQSGSEVVLARGDGRGGFARWLALPAGAQANHVAAGDLDRNGLTDVVATCYGSAQVFVFLAQPAE